MTKTETVYNALKQQILAGQIAPGERLVIRKIAEQFEVSEIPVREALKMLERDSLIEFVPYGGARVIELSPHEIKETLLIRSRLEALATRLAVSEMTFAHARELWAMIDEMDHHIKNGNAKEYGEQNVRFHQLIYSLIPYTKLRNLINDSWDASARMRSVFGLIPERALASNEEHREILKAIERGDEDEVERLALTHKTNTAKELLNYIQKNKEFDLRQSQSGESVQQG